MTFNVDGIINQVFNFLFREFPLRDLFFWFQGKLLLIRYNYSLTLARWLLFQGVGGAAAMVGPATYVESGPTTEVTGVLLGAARSGGRWGEALLAGQREAYRRSLGRSGIYDDLMKAELLLGDPALPVEQAAPQAAPVNTDIASFDR